MNIIKKSTTVSLNDAEKRTLLISAHIESKQLSPYIRDASLEHAKKIIADHSKNNASNEQKDALRIAVKMADDAIQKRSTLMGDK